MKNLIFFFVFISTGLLAQSPWYPDPDPYPYGPFRPEKPEKPVNPEMKVKWCTCGCKHCCEPKESPGRYDKEDRWPDRDWEFDHRTKEWPTKPPNREWPREEKERCIEKLYWGGVVPPMKEPTGFKYYNCKIGTGYCCRF